MATASVNSILLSSDDPDALSRWYETVFEATVSRDEHPYQVLDLDGFFIMFDRRDDVAGPSTAGARIILNVEIDDPVATAARIDELGGEWVSPLENRDGHHFATAKDPDGNWIQLVRLSDEAEAEMGQPTTPFSGFAVRDIDETAEFYSTVLGMRVMRNSMGILMIRIDRRTTVIAYPKPDHEPASFTVLNIPVTDIHASVAELTEKGVSFLRYDGFPQGDNGVMTNNGPSIAWFTDPSGNVISVISREG
ncbi:VOC family protein [Rhodococcus sp. BP-349]|uniref:VOC family protein n=1 Tax=unclassified Rhodococcus (in: high G+C Gram-positive bacteria) TaxID=192944 RepID=UPI001C9BB4C4|nr:MULTISPECIES: VOC family protein [unclassified Rhodococcus (in: high G+C Gram-positive bacteria)]MBY6537372.1 VOC family protein [Rhodococcus sp. BP-363]MBY6541709.1 VOC family protein [Rhodococcus sp. BP-369]MBY6560939.1 VOC family protein [Rhodococcus sp. BP-370]MBY6575231.1 VOC family protein [Rhodococcus sp. BP-364]MBY6584532.1 VOC family protein [Rhodococcus sp. BP-358]